jgi:hypothetical protein
MGVPWASRGGDDVLGANVDVVVAEDAEALGGLDAGEDFGGEAGGSPGDANVAGPAADVVAGNEDQVRIEGIYKTDDALEEKSFGVLLEMDVADLYDTKAYEGVGKLMDGEVQADDLVLMTSVGSCIGSQADGRGCRCGEERSARDGGPLGSMSAA